MTALWQRRTAIDARPSASETHAPGWRHSGLPPLSASWCFAAIAVILVVLAPASPSKAATQTVYATKDAHIDEEFPDDDNSSTDMRAFTFTPSKNPAPCDWDHDGYIRATPLIRFDLSAIPSGSTITSCELHLDCWETGWVGPPSPSNEMRLYAYRVTSFWPESVTWNTKPNWTTTPAPYVLLDSTGPMVMDDSKLAQIAQMWVNGTAPNHGLLLWADEDTTDCDTRFYSSETASAPSSKPYLEVSYSAPVAGSAAVLLEVHPDERAQGPAGGPKLGGAAWQPSGLGPGAWYKWKVYQFDGSANLWIQVCAQCFSSGQNAVGDSDKLQMKMDGTIPNDVWGIMSGPPGSSQWDGNSDYGNRLTLEFQPTGLSAGKHTLVFSADETPIIWWLKVCDLEAAAPQ